MPREPTCRSELSSVAHEAHSKEETQTNRGWLFSYSFADYNKGELAVALDKHLRDNKSIFGNDKKLADYYKRLSAPARGASPVKREARAEVSPAERKTPGRRPKKQEEAT